MEWKLKEELQIPIAENHIFSNEKIFKIDYIPENILFRDSIFKELFQYFSSIFYPLTEGKLLQQTVVIVGGPGVGKTTIVKKFGQELEKLIAQKRPNLLFEYRYINCRRNRTVYSVLVTLMQSFIPEFPNRGFSSSEILRMMQDLLGQTQTSILLALDEINYLNQEPEFQDFLYSLTRLNDEFLSSPYQNISLIFLSQNRFFLDKLDASTKSSLIKNLIKIEKYSGEEIYLILCERAKIGLNKETYVLDQLKLITQISDINGDARFAIELLWRFAKNSHDHYLLTDKSSISKIIKEVFPFNKQKLLDLSFQQKIFLFSVASIFMNYPDRIFATLSQIKTEYQLQIQEHDLSMGTGNTSLWNHLQSLRELELLDTKIVSKNYRGRFTKIYLKAPKELIFYELRKTIQNELFK